MESSLTKGVIIGLVAGVTLSTLWNWNVHLPTVFKETVVVEKGEFTEVWVTPRGEKYHVFACCEGLREAQSQSKRTLCLVCAKKLSTNQRELGLR